MVEAQWLLTLDPEKHARDWVTVQRAMMEIGEPQSVRHDGSWADDCYLDTDFADLRVRAADAREQENDERLAAMAEEDAARAVDTPQLRRGIRGDDVDTPNCILQLGHFLQNIQVNGNSNFNNHFNNDSSS